MLYSQNYVNHHYQECNLNIKRRLPKNIKRYNLKFNYKEKIFEILSRYLEDPGNFFIQYDKSYSLLIMQRLYILNSFVLTRYIVNNDYIAILYCFFNQLLN